MLRIEAHLADGNAVAWSLDSSRIATGSTARLIKIWHAETGEDMITRQGHDRVVTQLAWSPDGRALASCDGTEAIVWDASRGYR